MAVRTVFFDLYNTLAGFDPPREVIQSRAAAEFGIALTREGVDSGYQLADAFMAEQNAKLPVRRMGHQEREDFFARFEQLVLRGAGHEVDMETAGRIWRQVRKQEYRLALFPDVVPGLAAVRAALSKACPGRSRGNGPPGSPVLAVISNINSTGPELCESLGLTGHVDFAVTSSEVGAEKPHPPIFQAVLHRAGVEPGEAVHVGDQLDSDIAGALDAGIRPILMDRFNGHSGYTAHPRVTGMRELPAVLGQM